MDEIIRLLRAELALTMKLFDAARTQREALKSSLDGRHLTETTQAVDDLLRQLATFEKQKGALLQEENCRTVAEFLNRSPYSKEKMEAKGYIKRLEELLKELQLMTEGNRRLLKNDTEYLMFSMNVMTQAQAEPGYKSTEEPTSLIQRKKLFDRSV